MLGVKQRSCHGVCQACDVLNKIPVIRNVLSGFKLPGHTNREGISTREPENKRNEVWASGLDGLGYVLRRFLFRKNSPFFRFYFLDQPITADEEVATGAKIPGEALTLSSLVISISRVT